VVSRRWSLVAGRPLPHRWHRVAAILFVVAVLPTPGGSSPPNHAVALRSSGTSSSTPVDNFTASINRLVDLVALAGSGILALVWARVALSWFSNDITKKIQAKDRARDALIGTLLFMAAVTGLLYGLANWVLTGS
jgi:hypothetical protein